MGSALVTKSQNTVSVQNLMQSVQCNFKKKKISAFIPRENFFLHSSVHNGKGGGAWLVLTYLELLVLVLNSLERFLSSPGLGGGSGWEGGR